MPSCPTRTISTPVATTVIASIMPGFGKRPRHSASPAATINGAAQTVTATVMVTPTGANAAKSVI